MNNAKLVVTVIILCIVSPIMIGYAWPVDSTSETAWETGDPKDISNDAINAKLPVYVPYNDPSSNNQNVFDDFLYANNPEMITGAAGPVWSALNPTPNTEQVYVGQFGYYTITNVKTWQDWTGVRSVVFSEFDWLGLYVGDIVVDLVVYYPASDKLFYKPYNTDMLVSTDIRTITLHNSASYETVDLSYITYLSEDYYAELSFGMIVPRDTSVWANGYLNKNANIIFGTTNDNQVINLVIKDPNRYYDTSVQIKVTSKIISLKVTNNDMYYEEDLGSNSIYDKVLLTIDYDTSSIVLSGLRGMDSYVGDYASSIRESIKADWQLPIKFYSFTIDRNSVAQTSDWYVADTLSALAEVDGSHNYSMDLRDYTANGSCQLNIRNVTEHGNMIEFRINSHYIQPTIEKGMITVLDYDGNLFTVPVNNLLVALIGNSFYINGHLVYTANSITEAKIIYHGDWKMSLIYYPVTETSVTGYSWLPGGFGLDVDGFCMVGLLTSALSGLAASLYGRRSGTKMIFVTFTSGIIAAVYLIILMGGL